MESLSDETWDVIIVGTSLSQSLLALALSKCNVKVLHVDQNEYYGGIDAGLSLDEAQRWIDRQTAGADPTAASQFTITKTEDTTATLGPSRAYTLSLKPQIVYAKSRFLPTLVSSQIHTQLEFQAVGSFFVYTSGNLQKIPSNREDVFADDTLSVGDKRRLMRLLRYVVDEHGQDEGIDTSGIPSTLFAKLQDQFHLPHNLLIPVQALALITRRPESYVFDDAMSRLKRHLMSTGYFGPGLAAVMAKYGGNSEIAQVACRAGAVGGFVYLLGHGVSSVNLENDSDQLLEVQLSNGTKLKTKHLAGMADELPPQIWSGKLDNSYGRSATDKVAHNISVVSKPLRHLFAATAENGPVPAVAIVFVDDGNSGLPPIYLQVHSEDTGECPTGQCIIHASTVQRDASSQDRLNAAIISILSTSTSVNASTSEVQIEAVEPATVLWSMAFTLDVAAGSNPQNFSLSNDPAQRVVIFPDRTHDLAFDDSILDNVKAAWETVLGERSAEYDFLRFEERREEEEEE